MIWSSGVQVVVRTSIASSWSNTNDPSQVVDGEMEVRQFRMVLAILSLVAVAVLAVAVFSVVAAENPIEQVRARSIVYCIGFGLLPVAAIGLWEWRRWGFWMLGLATVMASLSALPDGLFAAVWCSFLHVTTILLVTEQHFARKEEQEARDAEEHSADQHG